MRQERIAMGSKASSWPTTANDSTTLAADDSAAVVSAGSATSEAMEPAFQK